MPVTINASTSTGLVQSADTSGVIELQTNGTTVATVNTSNNVQFRSAISVGNATPTTSGAGITFPATQSASTDANTLDDYEEGSWNPIVQGSSTVGTVTYVTRNARYTKVGRLVQIELYLNWNSGTGTGNLQIGGLPFTSSPTLTFPALAVAYVMNLALSANNVCTAYVNDNATTIIISQYPVGGGAAGAVNYDASGEILLSGTYSV